MSCVSERELAQFVCGLLAPEPAAALREHLTRCPPCQATHAKMSAMTARLEPDPDELEAPELGADVMSLIRLSRGERERVATRAPRRWAWLWAPAAVAAAAGVLLIAWPRLRPDGDAGFRARGGPAESLDRWVSIEVFRATPEGYEPVGAAIASDDALAFAYSNPSDDGYRYLMVLAIDDRGRVFWYYPPREDDRLNPRSVPIGRSARSELGDEIRHQLDPGRLRIFGLFSKEPLEAVQVEGIAVRDLRVAGSVERLDRLGVGGVGQQSRLVAVRSADGGARR